ncbi:diacylglycerol kinase [Weizmannia acidilactici]|uniref:Diacylglycerol kinase n=1 Tax=Weizmannia acidilactici TaxID=2607726 RepID=A0A5J4JKA4_9BACI|nr:diacylglycerol kinase family protein [Weizmannia acidilactici]GER66460.1 diacylglycerol kinase [Weizmannia acidilactici]GER69394.1 diacylglycerol kinase [Weizmannia acidilactici]GER72278.1 diacylglycerol kinase [Weizmannia acidilactici]
MKPLIFIVNPAAKNGACLKVWEKMEAMLGGLQYDVYFSKYRGHAKELAEKFAKKLAEPVVLVAVGGDGTIHEVINGVHHFSHVTVAYIPAGSGNDFARGYRLPKKPQACIRAIFGMLEESPSAYDLGHFFTAGGKEGYFVNSLGAGFDAVISERANRSKLKKWLNRVLLGKLAYVLILVLELFKYRPVTVEIAADGVKKVFRRTWLVAVSNQPYYGGGMKISPVADPSDGMLNMIVVHDLSRLKLLLIFFTVFLGKHEYFKEVSTFTGTKMSVISSTPLLVHADGEIVGRTPIELKICPEGWNLLNTGRIASGFSPLFYENDKISLTKKVKKR